MDYKKYQQSRNLSWDILLKERITSLPVNVVELCRNLGISIKYYDSTDNNDGKSMIVDGRPIILVNKNYTDRRKRFTIAHELGHILLGHVGMYGLVNREPSANDDPIEKEANVFASRLLAPACVLWGCGVNSAEEIAELCNISTQAAEYRMERIKELYRRNKFLTSPLERAVYTQFKGFILNHQRQVNP